MKNLFTAILFSIILAGVSLAQTVVRDGASLQTGKGARLRIAVLEFTVEPKAAGIAANGTQTLQNGIAAALGKVNKIEAISVKRSHSTDVQSLYRQLLDRPIDGPTAVKIGKLLGVNYVMTGSASDFRVTFGGTLVGIQAQVVNVASGMVVWSGPIRLDTANDQATIDNVMKPVIQKLTASLKAADL